MKNLYLIGGTMGSGKTTACRLLMKQLPNSVFLDGDWCWYMNPFRVTDETKAMVQDNICHLLNNFLACSVYENVIFCWVMHEQSIIDTLLSSLNTSDCRVICVSLTLTPEELRKRIEADIKQGIRDGEIVERSVERLPLYDKLDTVRLDVTSLSPQDTADKIANL